MRPACGEPPPLTFTLPEQQRVSRFSSGPVRDNKGGVCPIRRRCRACASGFIGCIEVTSSESAVGTGAALEAVAWTV